MLGGMGAMSQKRGKSQSGALPGNAHKLAQAINTNFIKVSARQAAVLLRCTRMRRRARPCSGPPACAPQRPSKQRPQHPLALLAAPVLPRRWTRSAWAWARRAGRASRARTRTPARPSTSACSPQKHLRNAAFASSPHATTTGTTTLRPLCPWSPRPPLPPPLAALTTSWPRSRPCSTSTTTRPRRSAARAAAAPRATRATARPPAGRRAKRQAPATSAALGRRQLDTALGKGQRAGRHAARAQLLGWKCAHTYGIVCSSAGGRPDRGGGVPEPAHPPARPEPGPGRAHVAQRQGGAVPHRPLGQGAPGRALHGAPKGARERLRRRRHVPRIAAAALV